ncbi:MAG: A/G-specific adenine glycosylase [Myxococcota bacterium]|nr:A/G-specific adenine glycosylase [Myxococcota bacterium]
MTWYQENKRDLPWRLEPSPYRIWLSEIMCQQTRIDTAIPYYLRFLERWPTVEDLANASLDSVLQEWAGLGYYSRARNLHKAAQAVADLGAFPTTFGELHKLPGVGRYTAAAIASMAFGGDEALVDGNVERVLSRYFGYEADVRSTEGKKGIWDLAEKVLVRGQAGTWNQALMEWGALVCVPKSPKCEQCPVQNGCVAFREKRQSELPFKAKKTKVKVVYAACGVLVRENSIYLRQRPSEGLLAGLWECPSTPFSSTAVTVSEFQEFWRDCVGPMGEAAPTEVGVVRHVFSHRKLTLRIYDVPDTGFQPTGGRWVDLERPGKDVALSRLTQKVLEALG